ncbi:9273_t:CDS:2 [Ambispora leptoticha]|uniref:9273_t:CDS:1 n=1 Tax=Ambispora leptoticha TaxID=144679 RepID=A0A9N8YRE3_9GLOM|nr:9273_t:CDS:2 [Ambispora leptoticha]
MDGGRQVVFQTVTWFQIFVSSDILPKLQTINKNLKGRQQDQTSTTAATTTFSTFTSPAPFLHNNRDLSYFTSNHLQTDLKTLNNLEPSTGNSSMSIFQSSTYYSQEGEDRIRGQNSGKAFPPLQSPNASVIQIGYLSSTSPYVVAANPEETVGSNTINRRDNASTYSRRLGEVTETTVSETSNFSQHSFFHPPNLFSFSQPYREYSTFTSANSTINSKDSIDPIARPVRFQDKRKNNDDWRNATIERANRRSAHIQNQPLSFQPPPPPPPPITTINSQSMPKKRPLSPMPSVEASHQQNNRPRMSNAPPLPEDNYNINERFAALSERRIDYRNTSAQTRRRNSLSAQLVPSRKRSLTPKPLSVSRTTSLPRHSKSLPHTSKRASSPVKQKSVKEHYTMDFIHSNFDTRAVLEKPENADWLKDPKSYLNNRTYSSSRFQNVADQFFRATVTLELEGTKVIGHGDATKKKEAEKIAVIHVLYQLEAQDMLNKITSSKERLDSDSKKHVFEYCARFDHVPYFKLVSNGRFDWRAEVDLPSQEIVGRGRGRTKKEAELRASQDFKRQAEEYQARHGGEPLSKTEGKTINEERSRDFIRFYAKYFKFKSPECKYKAIGSNGNTLWDVSIIVENSVIGSAQRPSKRDAQTAAFLDAAIGLRTESPQLWEKFEQTKSKDGKRTIPLVPLNMGEQTHRILRNLVHDIRDAPMFYEPYLLNESKSNQKGSITTSKDKRTAARAKKPKCESPEQTKALNAKSAQLYASYQKYLTSNETKKMRDTRYNLPITQYAETIIKTMEENPIMVIVGSTGCGKTTQLPQLILEDAIKKKNGARCNIVVTQPRRIAAISVAQRVAVERAEKLGATVGYQVRFESVMPSSSGSILYCTTGLFLRRLHDEQSNKDPLEGVTHIVIDEVHERDMNTDFLLVILKRLLDERRRNNLPPIKLILMSATIDTGIFAEYFGNFFPNGRCPVIEVPGKIYPVEKFYLDDIITQLQTLYKPSETPQFNTKDLKKYIDREMNLVIQPKSSEVETDSQNDEIEENDDASVETSSSGAIIDWKKKSKQQKDDELADAEIPYELMGLVLAHIAKTGKEGSVLVFLPGWEEITALNKILTASKPLGVDFNDQSKFTIHMLHSSLPSISQKQVFDPLPNSSMRKIILATNIAETSITIPDIVYVIDSGKLKEKRYDQSKRMTALITTWISQSNARQRAGRAGRMREGVYYSMMSNKRYQNIEGFSTPELLRSDLQEICLQIKALDLPTSIADVLAEAIEPPDHASVTAALDNLKTLQALDNSEELTPLGKVLVTLPVEPALGKMVLLGTIFQCLDPILTIAASMGSKSPFFSPPGLKQKSDACKMYWAQGQLSDHFSVLNVYKAWYEIQSTGKISESFKFCSDNFLNRNGLQNIERIKIQLLNLLERSGVVPRSNQNYYGRNRQRSQLTIGPPEYNINANCIPLLRAIICAGVYPNISVQITKRKLGTRDENTIIHPSSVNSPKGDKDKGKDKKGESNSSVAGTLYAYSEKVKSSNSQIFLRDTTRVDPLSVILFGGESTLVRNDRSSQIIIDEWLKFEGHDHILSHTTALKSMLDCCLTNVYQRLDSQNLTKNKKRNNFNSYGDQYNDQNDAEKVKYFLVNGIADILISLNQDMEAQQKEKLRSRQ